VQHHPWQRYRNTTELAPCWPKQSHPYHPTVTPAATELTTIKYKDHFEGLDKLKAETAGL